MDKLTEAEFEITSLRKRLEILETENRSLLKVIKDNDLVEDLEMDIISDEELICVNEIRKLKELSDNGSFGKEESQILDILHKNLRLIRGQSNDLGKKPKKKASVTELFKIVNENK